LTVDKHVLFFRARRAGARYEDATLHGDRLTEDPSLPRIRLLTLFASLSHLANLADPRKGPPSPEMLKPLRDAVEMASRADPRFGAILADWVKETAQLVADVRSEK